MIHDHQDYSVVIRRRQTGDEVNGYMGPGVTEDVGDLWDDSGRTFLCSRLNKQRQTL